MHFASQWLQKKIALESMVYTGASGYKNNCTGESMVTRKQALLFMMERMSKNRNEPVPTELPTFIQLLKSYCFIFGSSEYKVSIDLGIEVVCKRKTID